MKLGILECSFPMVMVGKLLFLRIGLKYSVNEAFESALGKNSMLGRAQGTLGRETPLGQAPE